MGIARIGVVRAPFPGMRALVVERAAPIESMPLRLLELPDPEPGPGEVRLRVRACAICRTDLHVIEGDLPRHRMPIIPGHQIVGVVDRLGSGCSRLQPGQRVGVAWLHSTCGTCRYCTGGKENLCGQSLYTGYDVHGGFAEYAIAREAFAYPLPDSLRGDAESAPLLCAGIIGYRALERSALPPGGKLGIFGFGSSAHIVIQLALHRGARVYVVTRAPEHQELARKLGATWAGDDPRGLPAPLDSAILFAPAGELVPQALESLDKGGTLAVAGIHLSPIPRLDYRRHLFFERDLRSVTANSREDGIRLLKEPVHAQTRHYPLEQANQALRDLKQDRIQGTGVLLVG